MPPVPATAVAAMTASVARRFAGAGATAVLVMVLLTALAAPAGAHGRGSESTNFNSRVTSAPEISGVEWDVFGGDQYLSVTNSSDAEVIVEGYEGEPYLRVGPGGVEVNLASEAAYVNEDRFAEVESIPADVGPDQEPRWSRVSSDPTYAWHDHRIHWMSPSLPPQVTDPSKRTVVNPEWEVPFAVGGQDQFVRGELVWVPPPSPVPWLGIALVLVLPALLGLRRSGGDNWVKRMVAPAAAVLAVVALLNATHFVDDLFAVPLPTVTKIVSAVQTGLFIALGLFGALIARRGRDGAFTALGVGAGGILVGQGLLYLDFLQASQSASVFPDWLVRLVVGLSIMQALTVGAVAVVGNRRLAAEAEPEDADAETPVAATSDG